MTRHTRDGDDARPTNDDGDGDRPVDRRRFLLAAGGVGTAATAGCLSALGFEQQSARVPPLAENRPDAVYHPTHVEAMKMVGMTSRGPYRVALSYSFPHRFWTVTGPNRTKVTIDADDSMHLMVSRWHEETGLAPPTGSVSVAIEREGETVDDRTPWSMLSQRMGFHFGDNVALPESGTYDVTVDVDPVGTRTTGALRGAFEEAATATFSMEFDPETVRSLEFTQFPDKAGSRAAIGPMEMAGPSQSQLPAAGDLPGRAIGEGRSGDGVFLVRALDAPPEGIDASGTYLAVSARTPYNRYPLALMSLSATLEGADGERFSGSLVPTIDPDLGYHYGATVGAVESGDSLTIDVGAVPQVSRHEGYETAFFDMGAMTIEV